MTTPEELREKASDLFAATHAQGVVTRIGDREIGTMPFGPGQTMVVTRYAAGGHARSFIRFRVWVEGPGDARIPLRGLGFSMAADGLPVFADLVARALEVERAELPWARQDGRRSPRPEDSAGKGAEGTPEAQR
jgi:hypothetical protein